MENSDKLMKNLVKGPKMRPREFLSLILILTSKTDQEFCSHHFNVNLRSLGPKMADLPLFSRNGPVDGAWNETACFFAWKPDFDLRNTLLFLFSSFWSKSEVSRTKIERSRAVFSFGQTIVKNRQKWAKKGETETEMLVLNENSLQKFFREFREKRIFAIRPFFGISWHFDYVPGDSAQSTFLVRKIK